MEAEHKREIEQELMQEEKEEPMYIWIEDNKNMLEWDFLESIPPEDRPLDDDIPDFFDNNCDEFNEYCKRMYHEDYSE